MLLKLLFSIKYTFNAYVYNLYVKQGYIALKW